MKLYLSENRIALFILTSAFVYTFLFFPILPWRVYSMSMMLCMLIVILYVLWNIDAVLRLRQYWHINLLAVVYFSTILISMAYNRQVSLLVLFTFLFRCAIFPFIELQRKKGHIGFLYKTILFWYGISLFLNDVLMVIMPGRFFGDGISRNFFLGNKFSVGYDHLIFLMIWCIVYASAKHFRKWAVVLFAATSFICYYINCRTAVLGTLIVFLVYLSPKAVINALSKRLTVTVFAVFCALFVFLTHVFRMPAIKYILTEVLHRDVTLTGRQQIYEILPKVIRRSPWLGYGSSGDIISRYTGAFDAQNGFFDLAVCHGIPSAIIFVILLVSLIKQYRAHSSRLLLGGIYAYMLMSMVEVTYGITLLFMGILLFTENRNNQEENVQLLRLEPTFSIRLF